MKCEMNIWKKTKTSAELTPEENAWWAGQVEQEREALRELSNLGRNPWGHVWAPQFCLGCHEDLAICGCINVDFRTDRELRKHDDEEQPELTGHEFVATGRGV